MGLFDFSQYDDPNAAGNLAFGAGLLNAAGPQLRPVSFGQALAQGLLGGRNAATEAAMNQRRNRLTDAQMEEMQQQAVMRQMQMEQLRRQMTAPAQSRYEKVGDNLLEIAPDGTVTPRFQGQKEAAQTELSKLMNERDRLPPGHPMRAVFDQAINKATTHTPGTNVTVGLQAPYAGLDAQGNPIVLQPTNRPGAPPQLLTDPRTGLPIRPPAPAADNKPMNDTQANASLYSTRMERADKIIGDLEGKYNRVWLAGRQAAGEGVLGMAANSRLPAEAQQVDQAQRDFLNAVLRRESGAVISPSEFANGRQQYFPQPGDTVEVVKQKADNRKTAIEGVRTAAGPRAPNAQNTVRYDAQGNRIP